MSLLKFFIVLTIVAFVSGRLSYYYADQGLNYHPPWDKYTGAYNGPNSESAVNNCNFTYNCPAGYVPRQNLSYVPTYTQTCPVPSWLQGTANSGQALTIFNSCCRDYSVCLQTCGVRKAFCDGQFEGCTYTACNPTRILRPGDRLYCRGLSSCISSYNARTETCSTFAASQGSACACVPAASASNNVASSFSATPFLLPSASPSPFTGKRQVNSESASASTTSTMSESQSYSYSPSNSAPLVSPNLYNFQNYFVRQIPQWNLFYNRCPPQFANYVAVFTDQDQDDIGYYGAGQGAAGSLNSWMF